MSQALESFIELDLFFMQTGKIFQTLQKVTRDMALAGIDYAVVGGIALVFHGYVRATQDIDLLLTEAGLEAFHQTLVGRGFVLAFPGAKRIFKDSQTGVMSKILVTGEFPGDGKPKSVSFPNPAEIVMEQDGIQVIQLAKLVELKLASGLSGSDRLKDLADVQELIRALDLPQAFTQNLDESVQDGYLQLWQGVDQARRERPNQER